MCSVKNRYPTTGNYRRQADKGIPERWRLCVLCDLGVVDDFHFEFHCPLHSDLKNHLFNISVEES